MPVGMTAAQCPTWSYYEDASKLETCECFFEMILLLGASVTRGGGKERHSQTSQCNDIRLIGRNNAVHACFVRELRSQGVEQPHCRLRKVGA